MALDVVALVSVGLHPVSRRPRRAEADARALELGLRCAAGVTALHAGPAAGTEVLRDYAGMGTRDLVVLDVAPDDDPLPVLAAYLAARRPDLVVAGVRAEAGEGSGMAAFWLAERLGYALATAIVAVEPAGDTLRLVQALPGGRRRRLVAPRPLIVTVDRTGPEPRLAARARALRAMPDLRPGADGSPDPRAGWTLRPSRPRPKRLHAPKGAGAAAETAQRREMLHTDPEAAADAILDFLDRDGLLAAPSLETKA